MLWQKELQTLLVNYKEETFQDIYVLIANFISVLSFNTIAKKKRNILLIHHFIINVHAILKLLKFKNAIKDIQYNRILKENE